MRGPHRLGRRRRRASALIATLVLLLLGELIIVGMVVSGARDHDLTIGRIETVQSFYAAEAGVNMALRELMITIDEDLDGTVGTISDDADDGTDPSVGPARVVVTRTISGSVTTLHSRGRAGDGARKIDIELY